VQIVTPLSLYALGACSLCIAIGIAIGKRRTPDARERYGFDTIVMQIDLARVFVFRIWLGRMLLKLSMWVIGGRASVLEFPE
jgi:hypothetical protein